LGGGVFGDFFGDVRLYLVGCLESFFEASDKAAMN
jgi:hypothetical protein